jgi:hypothetical protein
MVVLDAKQTIEADETIDKQDHQRDHRKHRPGHQREYV